MIALYIAAAGIVAVAVALLVARTPAKLRTADQRGITLQTLIVTAVLVLMAGAAGVVIIAITNNAQDNLEGQNSGIDARCEPWEIFDPTLDAAGRGGGQGGIDSSASGCVRVCYVKYMTASEVTQTTAGDLQNAGTTNVDLEDAAEPSAAAKGVLMFSRSNIIDINAAAATEHTLPVNGERSVDANGNAATEVDLEIKSIGGDTVVTNLVIELAPNQRYCRVWNTTDDEELFRSRN